MTTIAYTPGMFAADQCLTEESEDGTPINRTYGRKLKWRKFWGKRPVKGTVLAVASRGDSDAGEALDELILSQGQEVLKRGMFALSSSLNDSKLLKARAKVLEDASVDAILVLMFPAGNDSVYRVNGRGMVSLVTSQQYATGHDAGVAYGAMGAGANALRAVELAAKHGVCTSLPIDYLERVDGDIVFKTKKG